MSGAPAAPMMRMTRNAAAATASGRARKWRRSRARADGRRARMPLAAPVATMSPRASAIADPRVEEGIGDVDEEIEADNEKGDDDDVGGDDREIALEDRLQQQIAGPRPLEDRLGDEREADELAELQADHGNDRDEHVAQRVLDDDANRPQPLGPRGAHVVGLQRFDDAAPRQAEEKGELEHAERQGRQNEMLQPARGDEAGAPAPEDWHDLASPEGRQPAEPDGEDEDERDADDEGRHRHAEERPRQRRLAEGRARIGGGERAQRHAEPDGEELRRHGELDTGRQALENEAERRHARDVGDAEIAAQRVADE